MVDLKLLVDDSPEWLAHGTPIHVPLARGQKPHTVLYLEDVA